MKYNLSITYEIEKCKTRLNFLIRKQAVVDLSEKREKRTIDQNSLYWLWLSCIMNETGEYKDRLHEVFKQKFLGTENILVFDNQFQITKSTTQLDTKQMTDYLNRIQEFSNAELGILLPNPEDLVWADFYEHYKNYI